MLRYMFLDKEFIGKKLKEYRKLAKYTQEQVAEKIDIAEKHYGRLERGYCQPALDTFFKLIYLLNIPLSEFGINRNLDCAKEKEKIIREIFLLNKKEVRLLQVIIKALKSAN